MEGLEDGREGGEEDEAGEEEGDLAGPGGLVEVGVVVVDEEGEDVVDGVGAGEGLGGGGEETAGEGEGGGKDAVDAVDGEGVGDGEEEAAERGARATLLREVGLEERERGGEGDGHGFEAGYLDL